MFPFINCTNCGARFSVISDLPYDRPFTSMSAFQMCERCHTEYEDPMNRRFHAQTTSCPTCGPRYTLYGASGEEVKGSEPIKAFAGHVDAGFMGVMKGWGGMHLVSLLSAAWKIRERKNRPGKPFAAVDHIS